MSIPKKILVWLSGGVDSAVSAYLLKEDGYDVSCGFMINYLDEEHPDSCPTLTDLEEAKKVAIYLDLPFYTFDYREEYEKRIIEYIYREYEGWRTPNPDVYCNNLVKFDLFLEEALSLGFDGISTGHYARIAVPSPSSPETGEAGRGVTFGSPPETGEAGRGVTFGSSPETDGKDKTHTLPHPPYLREGRIEDPDSPRFQLLKWIDPSKDQSYFLSRLSEFQLSKAIFPIGHLLKSEVREVAIRAGLPNAERKDSQWLCFIGKVPMKEFLERRIEKQPGNILNTEGRIVGIHEWAYSYTIGQRKGIKVGGWPALFVIAKDTKINTITVWTADELSLYSKQCTLTNWVGNIPKPGKKYGAKIRYRQEDQEVMVNGEWWMVKDSMGNGQQYTIYHLQFTTPQRAIASGQICVIYDGEWVVGSGVICDIV